MGKLCLHKSRLTVKQKPVKEITRKPRPSLEIKLQELKANSARFKAEREKIKVEHQQNIDSFHGKVFAVHENRQAAFARLNSLERNVNREKSKISSRKLLEQRRCEVHVHVQDEYRGRCAGVR